MDHEAVVRGIGMSVDDDRVGAPAVILRVREEFLPIYVTPGQARAVELAIENEPPERPLTHDLLVDMLTEFGGAIDLVRIDDLANGTFFAKVDAERYEAGEPEEYVFDARPSDGIALALRVDCPLRVSASVIEEAGQSPEEMDLVEKSAGGRDTFLDEDPGL